ncbi:MAG: RidA family protein [Chloroflexi bacterium]|nr:RidA family protein [Chloroflexota bacterium]
MEKQIVTSSTVRTIMGGGSLATRVGPYLFLSGQMPLDQATGRPVRDHTDLGEEGARLVSGRMAPDSRQGPPIGQTWALLKQIDTLLKEQGSSIQDILLYVIYSTDMTDFPEIVETRAKLFAPEDPSPSTAAQASAFVLPESVICFDVIAVAPGDGYKKETIKHTGEFDHLALSHYQLGARAGQLVWLGGVVAAVPENGKVILSPSDLPADEAAQLTSDTLAAESWDAPFLAQTWFNLRSIQAIVQEHGASMRDVVRVVVYLLDSRHAPAAERLLRRFFPNDPPAVSMYCVDQLARPDFAVEVEAVFLTPVGPWKRATLETPGVTPLGHRAIATSAGPLAFISSLEAWDPRLGRTVAGLEDLGEAGKALSAGSLAADALEGPVTAQAWFILDQMAAALGGEAGLARVVKLNAYLRDIRDYPAFERVARRRFPKDPPAIFAMQTPGLPIKGSRIALDAIATA